MLDFSGSAGKDGRRGINHWGTALIGRDGNSGGTGGDGHWGTDGKNLQVKITNEFDMNLGCAVYFIYVKELETKKNYVYRWIENNGGIEIDTHGGRGGDGGRGGRGGNGKDGRYVEKKDGTVKYKPAGNGGDGGSGGDGGNGGDGGDVEIIVHEDCDEVIQYLRCFTQGGHGGKGGEANQHGGNPGHGMEGETTYSGQPGFAGEWGHDGKYGNLTVRTTVF